LYKLRQTTILEDRDHNPFATESIPTPQFQAHIDQSKVNTGNIVDEDIRERSLVLPNKPWTFDAEQVKEVRDEFHKIGHMFSSVSLHMTTNPKVLVEVVKEFLGRFVMSDWANVKDHGSNIKDMFQTYHKHEKRVRIEEPNIPTKMSAPGASRTSSTFPCSWATSWFSPHSNRG
jgi:hypothetical protein